VNIAGEQLSVNNRFYVRENVVLAQQAGQFRDPLASF
jgi:hypothetical protein